MKLESCFIDSSANIAIDLPSFVKALAAHPAPYKPFLPLLKPTSNQEDPIPLLTSSVLSNMISQALVASDRHDTQIEEALPQLFTALSALAKSTDAGLQDIAVQEYSDVLRSRKSRQLFWKQREETVTPLFDILRAASGAGKDTDSTLWSGGSVRSVETGGLSGGVGLQLLYHVLLVIWQLSFEGELVGDGLQEYVHSRGTTACPLNFSESRILFCSADSVPRHRCQRNPITFTSRSARNLSSSTSG